MDELSKAQARQFSEIARERQGKDSVADVSQLPEECNASCKSVSQMEERCSESLQSELSGRIGTVNAVATELFAELRHQVEAQVKTAEKRAAATDEHVEEVVNELNGRLMRIEDKMHDATRLGVRVTMLEGDVKRTTLLVTSFLDERNGHNKVPKLEEAEADPLPAQGSRKGNSVYGTSGLRRISHPVSPEFSSMREDRMPSPMSSVSTALPVKEMPLQRSAQAPSEGMSEDSVPSSLHGYGLEDANLQEMHAKPRKTESRLKLAAARDSSHSRHGSTSGSVPQSRASSSSQRWLEGVTRMLSGGPDRTTEYRRPNSGLLNPQKPEQPEVTRMQSSSQMQPEVTRTQSDSQVSSSGGTPRHVISSTMPAQLKESLQELVSAVQNTLHSDIAERDSNGDDGQCPESSAWQACCHPPPMAKATAMPFLSRPRSGLDGAGTGAAGRPRSSMSGSPMSKQSSPPPFARDNPAHANSHIRASGSGRGTPDLRSPEMRVRQDSTSSAGHSGGGSDMPLSKSSPMYNFSGGCRDAAGGFRVPGRGKNSPGPSMTSPTWGPPFAKSSPQSTGQHPQHW